MPKSATAILLMTPAMMLVCASGRAEQPAADPDPWQWSVTPYFWFAGIDGHITARGTRRDVKVQFEQVWDALDFGEQVHVETIRKSYGLFADSLYMKLSQSRGIDLIIRGPEDITLNTTARASLSLWILEWGGFYRIGRWAAPDERAPPTALDILVGGRYWDVAQRLRVGPLSGSARQNWIDPFIGLRLTGPVNDWLSYRLRADVGGFSVSSDASNLTFNAFAGPAIKLSDSIDLSVGYRWLFLDRQRNSDFKSNLTFRGPLAALEIRF